MPEPEKGEPHGAATLLRVPVNTTDRAEAAQLRISWAVFLPISDASDIVIPVDGSALGRFHLLLHGYFFLDSGRRQIEGLDASAEKDEPSDASALRRAWNAELRDFVVLPLLPALLRDTLDSAMATSAELAQLVSAIARNEWFRSNRKAICRESALARVLETLGGIVWRVVPSGEALRPLPASVANAPRRIEELFGTIGSWAKASGARLVVGESAALSAVPIRWTAKDLDSVFAGLSPRAFQSRDLARLLVDFLDAATLGEAERWVIGPHLVLALRKAMLDTSPFVSTEFMRSILAHVPHGMLFPLPASVENRQVFRALASGSTEILPLRSEWAGESPRPSQLSKADLKALLTALEPLIGGGHADQATTAALALLTRTERTISELARDPEFASIEALRARDVRFGGPIALSLQTLVERSRAGLLFANSPQANSLLPLLVDALPDAAPLVVEGKTADFLRDLTASALSLRGTGNEAIKESILGFVNETSPFGTEDVRRGLLERLQSTDDDDRAALRRLSVGERAAGDARAKLWVLGGVPNAVERIIAAILNRNEGEFLVPLRIAEVLTPKLQQHIGIRALDTAGMEALIERNLDAFRELRPTDFEREAFMLTQFSDSLLRHLPIHVRSDGTTGDAENVFREADWPVPEALRPHVLRIQPCNSKRARERQERLIEAWSPRSQIEAALAQAEPHHFHHEILDALAKLESPPEGRLREALGAKPWLLADEQPVRPQDVLALPPTVDEAARALLLKSGETPPFLPVAKLPIKVREHRGFARLEEWILPDPRSSFEALSWMIEDARTIGRLGASDDYPVDDFTALANGSGDLGLPGWPPGVQSATVDQRAEAIHRGMARLLRLLPDSASPHEPRSVDPSKIAFVSLAAVANRSKPLRGVTPSRRSKVCRSGRNWFTNWALAHVGHPAVQQALRNDYFESLGLPRTYAPAQA